MKFENWLGVAMAVIKALHVLMVFIWIGNLMVLSRLMAYQVKEEGPVQDRMAKILSRMYNFIQLPAMILAVVFGLILIANLDLSYRPGWFHMKITFITGLIICDMVCGKQVAQLARAPDFGSGVKYKILHSTVGLLLIAVVVSLFIVRDKDGEVLHRAQEPKEASGLDELMAQKEIPWQKTPSWRTITPSQSES